ncbi:chemotaxis protein CheW [Geomonas sp.]|uniref:chemotaxis protein CheW n=1 Tax=Geomonas sp. TaxID=2651584 RepID=UPI002B46AAB1|nr:chemotaxis protein CheW [Geomonas sp.]HJV36098.1 chemotaxis protein CheW [Geomonas sp.]
MNLAEIRRKAQRGEMADTTPVTPPAVAAPKPAPQPSVPASASTPEPPPASTSMPDPEPVAGLEWEPEPRAAATAPAMEWEPAPAAAAAAPAMEWEPEPVAAVPAPAAAPAPASAPAPAAVPFEWPAEPVGELLPGDFSLPDESDRFDPAAVILRGRETASAGEDISLAEEVGTATSLELLCFKVAGEEYAISIMDIKEIIKPREVTEVPRVPSFVRGVLSLRGIIIPIFDMRLRLGLPGAHASERERVIVVSRQSGFCGVLVDEVVQVVRIPEVGIEPPPVVLEGIDRDFVQGIGRVGGRMLILLDMEKVLDVSLV